MLYMFNTASIYAWSYIDSLSSLVNILPSCMQVYSMGRKLHIDVTGSFSEYYIPGEVHHSLQRYKCLCMKNSIRTS
jgi:hypothetical protein